MKKVICILMVMLSIFMIGGCGKKADEKKAMNIDYITSDDGTQVKISNGQKQEFFNVTKDKSQEVKITVKKQSGELSLKIFKTDDESNVVYEGKEFPEETFTVYVKEEGRYTIVVTCKDFVGEEKIQYDLSI